MASMKRKQYEAAFKARAALEAVKCEKILLRKQVSIGHIAIRFIN
jgi:hypothetical protein